MTMQQRVIGVFSCLLLGSGSLAAYDIPGFPPDQIVEYKQTTNSSGDPVSLDLHIFTPLDHQAGDQRAAIIFFFGGGWNSGSPGQFHPHCTYLASRGMVAISAEYRVRNEHGTPPQECVKDGKSAVRWVRANAAKLGIDPTKIVAAGGSAGGHVAAAIGTLTSYEEPGENLAISSKPDALVLFNPVYDNGPGGYGHSRVESYWEDFSPLHNIDSTTPPAIVFLGTNDSLIPVATATEFQGLMEAGGIRSDLHLYQDQPHSFFNYDIPDDTRGPYDGFQDTVFKTDQFLVSLGYLRALQPASQAATAWVTISGDSGFSGGSEATSSPVMTDADGDVIAAGIAKVLLADGEFMRLTGSATFDVELSEGNFRLGLFDGDAPVSAGEGSGYRGIWVSTPATTDAKIAAGAGTGTSHPFESASSANLGPVPAAGSPLAANTPLAFTLMIARNGDQFDLHAAFTDGQSFRQSQNLLDQSLTLSSFDRVAFLLSDNPAGGEVRFSDVEVSSGPVVPFPELNIPPNRVINYVDAEAGPDRNTGAPDAPLSDLAWLVDPGTSASNETQWSLRSFGNGSTLFQASHTLPDTLPELTTRITGLSKGTYELWAFYWDQVDNDTQNWVLSTGLSSGSLGTFSSPGEPDVPGASTSGVVNAATLEFSNEVLTIDGGGLRNLFGVNLGQVVLTDESFIEIFSDNLIGNGCLNRTWFDGVGYARVDDYFSWISGFAVGSETSPADDPDRDGTPNALENFFGTDPGSQENTRLTITETDTPTQATFTHPQSPKIAEDFLAQYQWSADLEDFYEAGTPNRDGLVVDFTARTDTPTPGITTVTVTTAGAELPSPLFLRIAVFRVSP